MGLPHKRRLPTFLIPLPNLPVPGLSVGRRGKGGGWPREQGRGSMTVRDFYENHPYPAPLRDLGRHRELCRNPDRRRAWSLLRQSQFHQRLVPEPDPVEGS